MMVVVDGVGAPTGPQPIKSLAYYCARALPVGVLGDGQPTTRSHEADRNGN
jgi:hypothetical protein